MIAKTFLTALALLGGTLWIAGTRQDGAAGAAGRRSTEEFRIDSVHSSLIFRVQHMSAAHFYGRFNEISGSLKVDDDDLDGSFINVEIAADSVDSKNDRRDNHLKSQDFFNVKEYPKITFKSTKVEKDGNAYKVTGDLSLHGVTRSVTGTARHTGTADVNPRFGLRCGYEAIIDLKRSDFGIDFMLGGALSDEVQVVLAVEGMLPNRSGRRR